MSLDEGEGYAHFSGPGDPVDREELLDSIGVIVPATDLRRLNQVTLSTLFAARSSGRIKMAPLLRSIIVQAHQLRAGASSPWESPDLLLPVCEACSLPHHR